jgi:UDP-N-acetylmuramoylalanine--D-glutamate ligase
MDRYSSIEEYAKAKYRIFNHAKNSILNRDDEYLKSQINEDSVTFGNQLDLKNYGIKKNGNQYFIAKGNAEIISVDEIKLKGAHNIQNIMAALALCEPFKISNDVIKKVISQFKAPPHRVEYVDSISGIDFYNDSKGTNVGATIAAIQSMTKPTLLIAGGDGKNQNFKPLINPSKIKVKNIDELYSNPDGLVNIYCPQTHSKKFDPQNPEKNATRYLGKKAQKRIKLSSAHPTRHTTRSVESTP